MNTELAPRLEAAIALAPKVRSAADVGCDHGLLTAALVLRGLSERVIASDISEKSLAKTRTLVTRLGLGERVVTVVSDGLSHIGRGSAECIFILGVGGLTIAGILERSPLAAENAELILQPQGTIPELRRFLRLNGYGTAVERLVEENGRIYHVLRVRRGASERGIEGWPADELLLAPTLADDPLLPEYAARLRNRALLAQNRARASGVEAAGPTGLIERIDAIRAILGR